MLSAIEQVSLAKQATRQTSLAEQATRQIRRGALLRRIIYAACVISACIALAGCFNRTKVVSVPQVLIQELQVNPGKITARVLLHNFSNIEMTFSELNYRLSITEGRSNIVVAQAIVPLDLLVPMDSPESTTITLVLAPEALKLLNSDKAFGYAISGTITSSKPSRVFEFNYDGQLSPTPGKPGFWR